VQGEINQALSTLLAEEINVVGCGRTDTGVHATQFFAHFETSNTTYPFENLAYRLNRFLQKDIAIQHVFEVGEEDHTRFSALSRTYHYKISTAKNPFTQDSHWWFERSLNLEAMNAAAAIIMQYNDFGCFCKAGAQNETNLCAVTETVWNKLGNELVFTITANRFLRNMVRAIVGTLVEIGLGKMEPQSMHEIIKSQDRSEAGASVPAHGLYLARVKYPDHIHKAMR